MVQRMIKYQPSFIDPKFFTVKISNKFYKSLWHTLGLRKLLEDYLVNKHLKFKIFTFSSRCWWLSNDILKILSRVSFYSASQLYTGFNAHQYNRLCKMPNFILFMCTLWWLSWGRGAKNFLVAGKMLFNFLTLCARLSKIHNLQPLVLCPTINWAAWFIHFGKMTKNIFTIQAVVNFWKISFT